VSVGSPDCPLIPVSLPSDALVAPTCRNEGRFDSPPVDEATVLWEPGLEVRLAGPDTEGREAREAAGCVVEGPKEFLVLGASRGRLGAAVEVRVVPPTDGRGAWPVVVPSCFVGDFVGDCRLSNIPLASFNAIQPTGSHNVLGGTV